MKRYLGDAVYAEFDGHNIILTTEGGGRWTPTNTIYLEPSVVSALQGFVAELNPIAGEATHA